MDIGQTMDQLNWQTQKTETSTDVINMRKILNKDAEKCKILTSIIKNLKQDLEQKNDIISELNGKLEAADHMLDVVKTKNAKKIDDANRKIDLQNIEFIDVLREFNDDITTLRIKINELNNLNGNNRNSFTLLANFEMVNINKNLNSIKKVSGAENRLSYSEQSKNDESQDESIDLQILKFNEHTRIEPSGQAYVNVSQLKTADDNAFLNELELGNKQK